MSDLWIEVDLDAVKHNYRQVLAKLTAGCTLMAVVKADAYGLGAVEIAKALEEEGCQDFAVTTVAEALILRQEGIKGRILVLGPSSPEDWPQAVSERIELTVSQLSWLETLDQMAGCQGTAAGIHLKLETGMGRTGFTEEQLEQLAKALHNSTHLEVRGAFTHLARGAQRDFSYSKAQHEKYLAYIRELKKMGVAIPCRHICNSAGFLDFPEYHYDMVRVGTLLIGHFPAPAFKGRLDLKDPWTCKARIVHLQRVPRGTYVGYQSVYKSKKETTLAVIPVGYAEGFGLEPKLIPQGIVDLGKIIIKNIAALFGVQLGKEKIYLKGKTVNIAGKVGMQLTVIDVGEIQCRLGDEVVLPLRRTSANPRIDRIYKKDGEIYRKRIIKEGFLSFNPEYSNLISK